MRPSAFPIAICLACVAGCQSNPPSQVAADVTDNFPALGSLQFSIPSQRGPKDSASGAVFAAIDDAVSATRSLSLLKDYLTKGGEEHRGLAVTIALDASPRIADPVVRYLRLPSRLDVERSGSQVCFYLQYNPGDGFDPDSAIGESRMIIEGSTVVPTKVGARSNPTTAHGLPNPGIGYMRFHFTHRPEDADPVRSAAQLDYDLGNATQNVTYFTLTTAAGVAVPVAFFQKRTDGGGGLVYASQRSSSGLAYQFLAQYDADGSLAVWRGDGKLWACYDAAGAEIGNGTNPAGCASFKAKFVAPPANSALWPALPSGLP